jgi:hypothetical protein
MTEPFLIAIPVMLLIAVVLLAFAGCTNEYGDITIGRRNGGTATDEVPTAVTGDATNIDSTQATLTGIVNPKGQPTDYHFEYGKTQSYDNTTLDASAGSGTADQKVDEQITNLDFDSEYHYRIVAQSGSSRRCHRPNTATPSWPPPAC